jgi:CubicO group peptidase (beta-lactamase class C family)
MLRTILLSFLLVSASIVYSQHQKQDGKSDQWDHFMDSWMKKDSVPGAYLLIAREGKLLKEMGYGYASLETKNTPRSTTVFETGTLTHLFTATAICQLAERRKIDLDSSISTYIDSLPQGWKLVTVRNLLYHSHGLNPQHYDPSLLQRPNGERYSAWEQLRFLRGQRQYALAGTGSYFSHSAYFLLGVIIERVSGTSYNDFIQQNIFDKAGMKQSSFISTAPIGTDRAQGYTIKSGNWTPWMLGTTIQSLDCNSFSGIVSTAADLLNFDNALQNSILLKREIVQQMQEPFILPDGQPAASGRNSWVMGASVREILGYPFIANISNTGSALFRFPKEGLTVILLSNLGEGSDYWKDKGADLTGNGYKLVEEVVAKYLQKK